MFQGFRKLTRSQYYSVFVYSIRSVFIYGINLLDPHAWAAILQSLYPSMTLNVWFFLAWIIIVWISINGRRI